MPRHAKPLSAAFVLKAPPGRYCDGYGLWLTVREPTPLNKFWTGRCHPGGKLREVGLGPAAGPRAVTLAQARRKWRDLWDIYKAGGDPLAGKAGSRAAARLSAISSPTFEKVAIDHIEANRSAWSNKEHTRQWLVTLQAYAFPLIGQLPVGDIKVAHIQAVLQPIWNKKRTTASRLRGRIEAILGRAKALGLRDGLNPAAWEENLDSLLPAQSKTERVQKHHPAMDYATLGDFMSELRAIDGPTARGLEFSVLTAARAGETRFATWSEIDLAKQMWIVPAEKMKEGVEHIVPLNDRSVEILADMAQTRCGEFIFQTDGKPLGKSDMLYLLQRRLNRPTATVHGMRSSFRTWCSERTSFPSEVAEIALAHGNKDKVRAAYDRPTFAEQRRQLSDQWGAFCAMPSAQPTGDVIAFGRGA